MVFDWILQAKVSRLVLNHYILIFLCLFVYNVLKIKTATVLEFLYTRYFSSQGSDQDIYLRLSFPFVIDRIYNTLLLLFR